MQICIRIQSLAKNNVKNLKHDSKITKKVYFRSRVGPKPVWATRPGQERQDFYKGAMTWFSMLLLTLERAGLLPLASFALLFSARNVKAKD